MFSAWKRRVWCSCSLQRVVGIAWAFICNSKQNSRGNDTLKETGEIASWNKTDSSNSMMTRWVECISRDRRSLARTRTDLMSLPSLHKCTKAHGHRHDAGLSSRNNDQKRRGRCSDTPRIDTLNFIRALQTKSKQRSLGIIMKCDKGAYSFGLLPARHQIIPAFLDGGIRNNRSWTSGSQLTFPLRSECFLLVVNRETRATKRNPIGSSPHCSSPDHPIHPCQTAA